MLISRAGSDYQAAQITLDAGHARNIMLMLPGVHAVPGHLYLDGTRPQAISPATAWLRESASPYTLPGLIDALDEVINLLCQPKPKRSVTSHPSSPQPATTTPDHHHRTRRGQIKGELPIPARSPVGPNQRSTVGPNQLDKASQ